MGTQWLSLEGKLTGHEDVWFDGVLILHKNHIACKYALSRSICDELNLVCSINNIGFVFPPLSQTCKDYVYVAPYLLIYLACIHTVKQRVK